MAIIQEQTSKTVSLILLPAHVTFESAGSGQIQPQLGPSYVPPLTQLPASKGQAVENNTNVLYTCIWKFLLRQ